MEMPEGWKQLNNIVYDVNEKMDARSSRVVGEGADMMKELAETLETLQFGVFRMIAGVADINESQQLIKQSMITLKKFEEWK